MTELPLLLIRADATHKMGIGHVMRCLALGQAWQDQGGVVHFCSHNLQDNLKKRLKKENFHLHRACDVPGSESDAHTLLELANQLEADCLVLDGYHFTQAFQDIVCQFRGTSVTIDDYGSIERYRTSYVLNANMGASSELYANRDQCTSLLIGIDYALIRREFLKRESYKRKDPRDLHRVLISMGGSDPSNTLTKVIDAISEYNTDQLEFHIIAGPLNPMFKELTRLCDANPRIKVSRFIDNLAPLYQWADLAITAGGSSNWEMCCFNLPRLVIQTASNQRIIAEQLAQLGIGINLGEASHAAAGSIKAGLDQLLLKKQTRQNASDACEAIKRRLEANRTATTLFPQMELREVCEDDMRQLFLWVNDPTTRANSLESKTITWTEHQKWFRRKMTEHNSHIFVGTFRNKPIGQIRFESVGEGTYRIGFSVAPDSRGRGFGKKLIEKGLESMSEHLPCKFVATIKVHNRASITCFEKLGFKRQQALSPATFEYLLTIHKKATFVR